MGTNEALEEIQQFVADLAVDTDEAYEVRTSCENGLWGAELTSPGSRFPMFDRKGERELLTAGHLSMPDALVALAKLLD